MAVSTPDGPTASQAEAAAFCALVLLGFAYILIKRYARRALPRTADSFRRLALRLAPRAARSAEDASRPPWLLRRRDAAPAPLTVTVSGCRALRDGLARPAGCAPWDRLTAEQAEVWFTAVLADEPEPWFSVAATGSFRMVTE